MTSGGTKNTIAGAAAQGRAEATAEARRGSAGPPGPALPHIEAQGQLKDWPQPQVRLALGLLMLNPPPWRLSL